MESIQNMLLLAQIRPESVIEVKVDNKKPPIWGLFNVV
jgi:hypothetical protein